MAAADSTITVPYSHLFPGLTLEFDSAAGEYDLIFADGSQSRATLLHDESGTPALHVDAYATAAATAIPERLWTITSTREDGGRTQATLGRAM
ncbi:hypothetical protein [Nocardia sp. NBC_01327]|uniref:hypothetical protein n=1 Tax=Nocardia sp. NBC_01327 TaxID=2903593 RepID=UPI002E14645E|nr:hypothetical protein OG326_21885 [Nocardia sp. NBC_01327]